MSILHHNDDEAEIRYTSEPEEIVGEHQKQRIRLHDGLNGNLADLMLNSSCQDCNAMLEWETTFHTNNECFTAAHCRRTYSIAGIVTGVRVITVSDEEAQKQVEKQKSKKNEAKIKKEAEEKQQKDKELADVKKLQEDRDLVDKKAADTQNKKDLAEIQKQGLNVDKEGGQADILKAQKDAETVSIHAEDPKTRKQAGTIADRLDQQTI